MPRSSSGKSAGTARPDGADGVEPERRSQVHVRVFLVDDHAVFRQGLVRVLEEEPRLEVVGEAASALEALRAIPAARPDVVVLDLGLPDRDGVEVVRTIKQRLPTVKLLVLSMYDDEFRVTEAIHAGVEGYLVKGAHGREVIDAILEVMRGKTVLSPSVTGAVVRVVQRPAGSAAAHPIDTLSVRERQVLRLLASGLSTREVGQHLSISPKTVETHRMRVGVKLGARRLADLIRIALRAGLVDP